MLTSELAGQRHRPLPGRGADLEAVRIHRAALGTEQDRVDRRHGRARLEHPGRRQGARGDADPAAQPRRRERGVAGRPVALHLGRAAAAAAGPTVHPRGRQAAAGDVDRGVRNGRRGGEGQDGQRAGRRPRLDRGGVRAEGPGREPRRRRGVPDRRHGAAGGQPVGLCRDREHRRHRRGAADPAGRDQPAGRGAGAERAAQEGLAERGDGRRGRGDGRPDLSGGAARRRRRRAVEAERRDGQRGGPGDPEPRDRRAGGAGAR